MRKAILILLAVVAVASADPWAARLGEWVALQQRRAVVAEVPWTPADLNDLFAWWKADSLDLTNNALVDTWTDSSGNGYSVTASAGARPTFKTSQFNSLPALYFGGSQHLTSGATNAWKFLHDSTDATIVAVFSATGSQVNPIIGNNGAASATIGISVRQDVPNFDSAMVHTVSRGVQGSFSVAAATAANYVPTNTLSMVSLYSSPKVSTANKSVFFRYGDNETRNNTAINGPSSANPTYALQVGASGNNIGPLTGYISEIVIIVGIASAADRQKLEGYLAHKWGLAGNLPSEHPYKDSPPTK
jgi:hypothetical protein